MKKNNCFKKIKEGDKIIFNKFYNFVIPGPHKISQIAAQKIKLETKMSSVGMQHSFDIGSQYYQNIIKIIKNK